MLIMPRVLSGRRASSSQKTILRRKWVVYVQEIGNEEE